MHCYELNELIFTDGEIVAKPCTNITKHLTTLILNSRLQPEKSQLDKTLCFTTGELTSIWFSTFNSFFSPLSWPCSKEMEFFIKPFYIKCSKTLLNGVHLHFLVVFQQEDMDTCIPPKVSSKDVSLCRLLHWWHISSWDRRLNQSPTNVLVNW